jgi:hypothetical protein
MGEERQLVVVVMHHLPSHATSQLIFLNQFFRLFIICTVHIVLDHLEKFTVSS